MRVFMWVLRILLAAVFLFAGVRKWLGDDAMVATFADWAGAVAALRDRDAGDRRGHRLLIPRSPDLRLADGRDGRRGLSEAFVLEDGDPVTPVILFAAAAWRERATILAVLQRLHLRSEPRSE